jgi:hypothetical protein
MPITKTASISPGSACSPSSPNYSWTGPGGFTAATAAINATVPGQYTANVNCATSPSLCSQSSTTLVSCFNYVSFTSGTVTNLTATSPTGVATNLNAQGGFSFPYNVSTESGADALQSALTAWLGSNGGGSSEVLLNKATSTAYIAVLSPYNFLTVVGSFGTANFQTAACNPQNFSLASAGSLTSCNYNVTLGTFTFNSSTNSEQVQACADRTITPSGIGCGSPSTTQVCANVQATPYMENGFFWRYEDVAPVLGNTPDILRFFTYTYFNGTSTVESTLTLWNANNTTALFLTGAFGTVLQSDLIYNGSNYVAHAAALQKQIGNGISTTYGHVSGLNFRLNTTFGTETLSHSPNTTYTNHIFVAFGEKHSPTQVWGGHNKTLNFGTNRLRLAKFGVDEVTFTITNTFLRQNATSVNISSSVCSAGNISVTLPKRVFLPSANNSNWNFIDASEPLTGTYTPFSTSCLSGTLTATPSNCTTPPDVIYEWRNPSNVIVGNNQVLNTTTAGTYTVTALCPSSRQWATSSVTI